MSTQVTDEMLSAEVRRAGGLSEEDAEWAICTTLTALGEELPAPAARALAGWLPERYAKFVTPGKAGLGDVERFYAATRAHEGTSPGASREHAQIVCRALGTLATADVKAKMQFDVSPELAALFEPAPQHAPPPPHGEAAAAQHHTVSTGRPGSRHPVSESRPPGAQTHSVVKEDNPHGETKLSSTHGTTQERLEESLSTAKPVPPGRTIADASD